MRNRTIISIFAVILLNSAYAQPVIVEKDFYDPFQSQILKAGPVLYNELIPVGAYFAYETGAGLPKWSLYSAVRYHSGSGEDDFYPVREHRRLELQPRFWAMRFLNGVFFAPSVAVYDNFNLTAGGVVGYQGRISNRFTVEGFTGILAANPTENFDFPIFLRLGLNIGVYLRSKK